MKKFAYLLLFLFSFIGAKAQVQDPVKWTSKIEKKSDTEYVLVFNATIEKNWHMYSQFSNENGSLPMVITFNNSEGNYEPAKHAEESPTVVRFNDTFGVDETMWDEKATLKHTIKVTNPENDLVQVRLDYQVCKEVCIQGENLFEFNLKNLTSEEVKLFQEVETIKKEEVANTENEEGSTDPWTIFGITLLAGILVRFTPCVFPMIPMTVSFFL